MIPRTPSRVHAARLLVLYTTPTNAESFDLHYQAVHIPLTKRLPGLRRYTLSRNVASIRGGDPYYLIAELEWDNLEALRTAFASPEGRDTADDMTNLTSLSAVHSMTFEADDISTGSGQKHVGADPGSDP